jgi:hypothetical protein
MGRKLTEAQLAQRADAPTRHGARSERQIAPLARNLKRNVLRQIGLRASDLDPVALGLLELYVRALSKVRLYDAWIDEHGLVGADGQAPGFMASYFAALNSARLSLGRFQDHMKERGVGEPSMVAILQGQARRTEP